MRNDPEVRLPPPAEPLRPGRPFTTRVTIRNTGPEVERYHVAPQGPLATWSSIDQAEVRIWPGDTAEVTLTVALPQGPEPPAGVSSIGVVVQGHDGTQASAVQAVEVTPHVVLGKPTLVPPAVETRHRARPLLMVTNNGNVGLSLQVTAGDRDGLLVHEQQGPLYGYCNPGETIALPIALRCRRFKWFGKPVRHAFAVTASAAQSDVSVDGVLRQLPVLTLLRLILLGVGLLILIAVLAVVWAILVFSS